jgi:hypothetical protein
MTPSESMFIIPHRLAKATQNNVQKEPGLQPLSFHLTFALQRAIVVFDISEQSKGSPQ